MPRALLDGATSTAARCEPSAAQSAAETPVLPSVLADMTWPATWPPGLMTEHVQTRSQLVQSEHSAAHMGGSAMGTLGEPSAATGAPAAFGSPPHGLGGQLVAADAQGAAPAPSLRFAPGVAEHLAVGIAGRRGPMAQAQVVANPPMWRQWHPLSRR